MIMSTVSSAAAAQCTAGHSRNFGLAAILKRWWVTYITWRIERVAIGQLWSMSAGELKDIGLTRSDIERAIRGEVPRGRASVV